MREAEELSEPTELFYAQPLEDNIFEWHFTIRGPSETDFDGGIYHGRILLPHEYPMKPPSIILLTNNGRFKVNEKICLSISGHHPETWLPSWSIRTALLALIGFMPTMGEGAIGSLDYTSDERKILAKKSLSYSCSICNIENANVLPVLTEKSNEISAEAKDLASQIDFKNKKNETNTTDSDINNTNNSNNNAESNTNEVIRRNINSENDVSSSSAGSLSPPTSPARQTSSSRIEEEEDSNPSMILLISILSAIFLFLFARRLYLTYAPFAI
jgi:ubiquitin-conjugating enzyme E2 J1